MIEFLTIDDVAEMLGCCRQTAAKLFKAEGFPALHIGRRFVVEKDAFKIWVGTHSVQQFGGGLKVKEVR